MAGLWSEDEMLDQIEDLDRKNRELEANQIKGRCKDCVHCATEGYKEGWRNCSKLRRWVQLEEYCCWWEVRK